MLDHLTHKLFSIPKISKMNEEINYNFSCIQEVFVFLYSYYSSSKRVLSVFGVVMATQD